MSSPEFTQHVGQIRDFEQLMVPAGETPWVEQYTQPAHPVDVVLYLGCNILRTAHLAYEVVNVFQALGVNFAAVGGPQFCCGIIHHRGGDVGGATRLSQATVAKVESYWASQVVMRNHVFARKENQNEKNETDPCWHEGKPSGVENHQSSRDD
jgi:Fe-S oxidoreductase